MLTVAAAADIAEIMRIERLPGYDAFVGRWTAEEHAAELASPAARYFTWREDQRVAGFAILQKYTEPQVQLRRIAVDDPGAGAGTRLLRAVIDSLFETSPAEAVDLQVRPENGRARKVYLREGFVSLGAGDPEHEQMLLTREVWAALPRRAA
jgi:ribosomal protein S18 acetylase RimI-like enzyme